jgi:hypothetical protein
MRAFLPRQRSLLFFALLFTACAGFRKKLAKKIPRKKYKVFAPVLVSNQNKNNKNCYEKSTVF